MAVSSTSRYYGLATVVVNGVASLAERVSPPQQDYPDALDHVVTIGDTLDGLAYRYYGREDLWWRIADANALVFPTDLAPGATLTIPPLSVATRSLGR
jgi:nucleoid-associated protein YgaU